MNSLSFSYPTKCLTAALCLGLAGAVPACSDTSETTTGKRIVLQTKVTAGTEATKPFTNSQGWSISLSTFVMSTAAFYYFDGATIFSYAPALRKSPLHRFEDLLGIKTAYAHPGHYIPGSARGQMLSPASFDLLHGDVSLPVGDGITGVVRSATFSYNYPAVGAAASELVTHVAVIKFRHRFPTKPFRKAISSARYSSRAAGLANAGSERPVIGVGVVSTVGFVRSGAWGASLPALQIRTIAAANSIAAALTIARNGLEVPCDIRGNSRRAFCASESTSIS